jgi:hypothetical protein
MEGEREREDYRTFSNYGGKNFSFEKCFSGKGRQLLHA